MNVKAVVVYVSSPLVCVLVKKIKIYINMVQAIPGRAFLLQYNKIRVHPGYTCMALT